MLLLRIVAAIAGGYALTSAAIVLMAAVLPMPLERAVLTVSQLGFALYAAVILWVFATHRPVRAVFCLLLATGAMGSTAWLLRGGAS